MKEILDKIELKHFISNDEFLKSKYPDDKNSINSKNMQIAYNTISNWENYQPSKLINLEKISKNVV